MEKIVSHKDILENNISYSEETLGRKGLSLALLTKYNLPVPPFFIITTNIFKEFVANISKNSNIATLEELRREVVNTPLPQEYISLIADAYRKMSGFGKAWVAVRSSISAPKYPEVTFSGQLDTYLNIRDEAEIEAAVKEVFASVFSDHFFEYTKKNDIAYSDISVGIIVQKMIQSEVSGIMYTFDPITLSKNNVSIEAVFGLGDVLNDGTINPDIYVVSKENYEIIEKKIVPQEWMKVRRIGDISSIEHVQKIKISKIWQYSQKLDENLIRDLAGVASRIETIVDPYQIIEWTMEGGNLWILQIKAISQKIDSATNEHKSARIQEIEVPSVSRPKTPAVKNKIAPEDLQETLLFLGTPASPGITFGKALIVTSDITKNDELLNTLLDHANKNTILVTDEFTHKLEPFFYKVGAIITNYGGINSDAAITARELHLPAIVGTRIATVFIQNNMLLKIDGSAGTVYRIDKLPTHKKKSVKHKIITRKNTDKVDVESVKEKEVERQLPDTTLKMFLSKGTGESPYLIIDELAKNESVKNYLGVSVIIDNLSTAVAKRLKKLKLTTPGTLHVIIEDNASIDSIMEKKRILSSQNIRRSKKVKILLEIGTFFSLLNLERLTSLSIDGFVFNLEKLQQNYGKSDIIDESLLNLLESNLQKVKLLQLEILGVMTNSEKLSIPLPKELTILAKAGCNAIYSPKGQKSLAFSEVQEFSNNFQNVTLSSGK
jgi:phosphoenolpyruvate synthase/pyruvate phosphate dikinase